MGTPVKEFGPGYDYPNRKFHFWAVILPTVLLAALAVVLMRYTGSAGSQAAQNPIITCPAQTCRPPGAADSAKPTKSASRTSGSAGGLSTAQIQLRDKNAPTVAPAAVNGSSRPASPSPSSNSTPITANPSSSPTGSAATPVLSVRRAIRSQGPSAATPAAVLSSA
jgi:hypothetical protein